MHTQLQSTIPAIDIAVRIERHTGGYTVFHNDIEQDTHNTYGEAYRSLDDITKAGLTFWVV